MAFSFFYSILLALLCVSTTLNASIKVLFTAAILEHDEGRRERYITQLKKLKEYGCDVYVVESCKEGPTYLDEYCEHVCYTRSNNPLESKSNNEIVSMVIGMRYFDFKPDDLILKVTGRYILEDRRFIHFVEEHADAHVIARIWNDADAFTGYFAIRKETFDRLIDHYYDVYHSGSKNYLIEHALGNFIRLNCDALNIVALPRLYDYQFAHLGRF